MGWTQTGSRSILTPIYTSGPILCFTAHALKCTVVTLASGHQLSAKYTTMPYQLVRAISGTRRIDANVVWRHVGPHVYLHTSCLHWTYLLQSLLHAFLSKARISRKPTPPCYTNMLGHSQAPTGWTSSDSFGRLTLRLSARPLLII